jgi:hypothetical protein
MALLPQVPSNLIPLKVTQLPLAPVASEDSLMMVVYQGNNYQIRVGDLLSVVGVPTTRQVIAGTGMTGGGQLSSNVTLSIAQKGVTGPLLEDSGVTPGVYGNATNIPVLTVDSTGRVMAASSIPVQVSGYVPETRQVIAGEGLTGGGALNTNVTLAANLSNDTPLAGDNAGSAGTATNMARGDHKHPAVDLADGDQVDGLLGLMNGGTNKSLVPDAGAIIWCGADGLYVGPVGEAGQVLVSNGTGEYTWGSAVVVTPQAKNTFFAGPTTGSDADPVFRAMVNADLPDSGATAGTYGSVLAIPIVTVNAKGVVTSITSTTFTGGLSYKGAWNASTNVPTLVSSTGTNGDYYVVSVAGNTNLNGITDWQVGDWALFNGTVWQKIDQTNSVTSVNGQQGAVVLGYSDVGAPSTSGTNATGTWAIGISGNAATATSATSATTADKVAHALTIGSGLSGTSFDGSAAVTITNTAPDQTVVLNNGTGISVTGTYPNFTVTNTAPSSGGTVTSVSVATANGFAGTVANATTTPAITLSTSVTGLLKGNGTAISAATSGTDYAPATSGSSILYGNGAGGFSNVTVGSGLSFTAGTLAATSSMVYPGAGIPNSTGSAWGTSYSTSGSGTIVALATGATLNNPTIGNYEIWTSTSAPSYAEGRQWYDSTAHSLAYYNDSANSIVHIGQDIQFKVINNTGSTIANGSPVYITSSSSGQTYPNIALAKADVAATAVVIGLTNGAIANGSIGYVTAQGGIDGVNTGTFTVGQVLYLSPYSAGQLMNTIPPTGITVQVGVVTYVDSSAGKIYVKQTTPLAVPASIITGQVAIANGGTNGTASPTAGGVAYGSGTAYAFTSAGTSGQVLTSAGSGTPIWATPTTGTVTSVSGTGTVSGISLSGTVTSSGSLTLGGTLAVTPSNFSSQTANTFLAAPNGSSGTPTFRAIVAADVPTLNQNTTGTAAGLSSTLAIASGGTGQTTASAAFNALSPVTSTGDLIIGNGTNSSTRLAIGSNATVLTSNGTTASWSALPANVSSFSAGTTGLTPSTGTTGAVTLAGTLNIANGGTGQTAFTANYIHYGSFSTSASLQFDGTTMRVGANALLGGTTNPIVGITGGANNYIQSYIYNSTNGASSSADIVAYANNSTDAHGWADMGFTSAAYADATYTVTGPNEAYLFGSAPSGAGSTGNLVYATDSTGSANAHQFYVGGFTQAKTAWKAQIDSTGLKAPQVNATNGLIVNSMTVSANYTVASGDSAMSIGPITVASGVSVTVSSGSRWVVI